MAAALQHIDLVELLLQNNAPVNQQDLEVKMFLINGVKNMESEIFLIIFVLGLHCITFDTLCSSK
jgi:hypothetical protein